MPQAAANRNSDRISRPPPAVCGSSIAYPSTDHISSYNALFSGCIDANRFLASSSVTKQGTVGIMPRWQSISKMFQVFIHLETDNVLMYMNRNYLMFQFQNMFNQKWATYT